MAVAFYDNCKPLDDSAAAEVDRVYCLAWHRFGEAEWAVLGRVCRGLPGGREYRDVPFWFGTDVTDMPHLYASVEQSGLQLCGVLLATDWLEWVSRFESGIAGLPSFPCD